MRHRVVGKKLGRSSGHRKMLRRSLVTQLLEHERIKTTKAKAQMIRPHVERVITIAKRALAFKDEMLKQAAELEDEEAKAAIERDAEARVVHARRLVAARLTDPGLVRKVFDDLAQHYRERPGGYTRVVKLGQRKGDAAQMVLIELVDRE